MINVGGSRIGTAEIESALLADGEEHPDSPVGNCVVVGVPDEVLGLSPCAFIVPVPPRTALTEEEEGRLRAGVKRRVGVVPSRFVAVPALPETYSGKYMRGLLRALVTEAPTPNLGALRNQDCLELLRDVIRRAALGKSSSGPPASQPVSYTHLTLPTIYSV